MPHLLVCVDKITDNFLETIGIKMVRVHADSSTAGAIVGQSLGERQKLQ